MAQDYISSTNARKTEPGTAAFLPKYLPALDDPSAAEVASFRSADNHSRATEE